MVPFASFYFPKGMFTGGHPGLVPLALGVLGDQHGAEGPKRICSSVHLPKADFQTTIQRSDFRIPQSAGRSRAGQVSRTFGIDHFLADPDGTRRRNSSKKFVTTVRVAEGLRMSSFASIKNRRPSGAMS